MFPFSYTFFLKWDNIYCVTVLFGSLVYLEGLLWNAKPVQYKYSGRLCSWKAKNLAGKKLLENLRF